MTLLLMCVGSRGDLDPFIAIALRLRQDGHRVRLATHASFRKTVLAYGLEFYPLAGDPTVLTEFMIRSSGRVISPQHIFTHLAMVRAIIFSCWDAAVGLSEDRQDAGKPPFPSPDAIISNPVTWGALHVAEALACPLVMAFPQPWSIPTRAFPFPISGNYTNPSKSNPIQNLLSYTVFDKVSWFGLSSTINEFRVGTLGLPALGVGESGPTLLLARKIPFICLWSAELLPRPVDYPPQAIVAGFFPCLPPPPAISPRDELQGQAEREGSVSIDALNDFLERGGGGAPICVTFGSMPLIGTGEEVLSTLLLAAALNKKRILFQRGWGWGHVSDADFARLGKAAERKAESLQATVDDEYVDGLYKGPCLVRLRLCSSGNSASAESVGLESIADNAEVSASAWSSENDTFLCGSVPHTFLFPHCCAIVTHGGAGTLSTALRAGKPVLCVPFFGDQFLWAKRCRDLGLGPKPVPITDVTLSAVYEAFKDLSSPTISYNAQRVSQRLAAEDGPANAVAAFYRMLPLRNMVCEISILLGQYRLATVESRGGSEGQENDIPLRMTGHLFNQLKDLHLLRPSPCPYMIWKNGPESLCGGLVQGLSGLVDAVLQGVAACLTEPVAGGVRGGVGGGVKGLGIGLLRLVKSPVLGLTLLAHKMHCGLHAHGLASKSGSSHWLEVDGPRQEEEEEEEEEAKEGEGRSPCRASRARISQAYAAAVALKQLLLAAQTDPELSTRLKEFTSRSRGGAHRVDEIEYLDLAIACGTAEVSCLL